MSKNNKSEQKNASLDEPLTQQSIEDIKKNYPDEWILLGNPVRKSEQERDILSGVVLYHSRDKREVAYLGRPRTEGYDRIAHFFNRVTPRPKRAVLGSIYSNPINL